MADKILAALQMGLPLSSAASVSRFYSKPLIYKIDKFRAAESVVIVGEKIANHGGCRPIEALERLKDDLQVLLVWKKYKSPRNDRLPSGNLAHSCLCPKLPAILFAPQAYC